MISAKDVLTTSGEPVLARCRQVADWSDDDPRSMYALMLPMPKEAVEEGRRRAQRQARAFFEFHDMEVPDDLHDRIASAEPPDLSIGDPFMICWN